MTFYLIYSGRFHTHKKKHLKIYSNIIRVILLPSFFLSTTLVIFFTVYMLFTKESLYISDVKYKKVGSAPLGGTKPYF